MAIAVTTATVSWAAVGDQFANVEIQQSEKMQAGRVAFVDTFQTKLIEIDTTGQITWEYEIPRSVLGNGRLIAGTDVKWLAESDHFLLAIPAAGVFEVNRTGQVVWQHLTPYADHDADRLENGNTVFVNAWDGDNDPILTEVDGNNKVVYQLFANDLGLNANERHPSSNERYSNTHANAVQKLGSEDYLLSLRNFDQFVRIKAGKVVEKITQAPHVHDPVTYKDGYLFAVHKSGASELLQQVKFGQRSAFFVPEAGKWHPMRTLEILHNGNILITGSQEVGQLDKNGALVWSMVIPNFSSGKFSKSGRVIYKAAFVYK